MDLLGQYSDSEDVEDQPAPAVDAQDLQPARGTSEAGPPPASRTVHLHRSLPESLRGSSCPDAPNALFNPFAPSPNEGWHLSQGR